MFIFLNGELYKLREIPLFGIRQVVEMLPVKCSTCHKYSDDECKEKRLETCAHDIAFNCKDWWYEKQCTNYNHGLKHEENCEEKKP